MLLSFAGMFVLVSFADRPNSDKTVKPLGGYTARIVDGNSRAPKPTDLQVLLAHRAAKPADPANAPPARNVTNHGDLSRIMRNLSQRIGRLV